MEMMKAEFIRERRKVQLGCFLCILGTLCGCAVLELPWFDQLAQLVRERIPSGGIQGTIFGAVIGTVFVTMGLPGLLYALRHGNRCPQCGDRLQCQSVLKTGRCCLCQHVIFVEDGNEGPTSGST